MKARNWIKVEDRLPEIGENVLCATKGGKYMINSMYIPKDCKGNVLGPKEWRGSSSVKDSITHWMPIVPPKEDLVIEDKAEYTCKHCDPYCGQCYIKSYSTVESIGTVHYNLACTGKCEKYEKED